MDNHPRLSALYMAQVLSGQSMRLFLWVLLPLRLIGSFWGSMVLLFQEAPVIPTCHMAETQLHMADAHHASWYF